MDRWRSSRKRMFAIKNEHIVGVQDLFEENGTAYYVMDYVDGENLAEHLKRTGKPMTEQEVRDILPQILDALKSIHDAGIWHLDLKPANILIDKSGKVKLIDFGASKQLNAQKGGATTSTAISYTNGYAPREQMEQNYDKFGPWTDIYALGATLYYLLTNKRPPLPTDIDDDMSEDKHKALLMSENASKEMRSLVLWMMQTDRNKRPNDVKSIMPRLSNIYQSEEGGKYTLIEDTIIDSVESENNLTIEALEKRPYNDVSAQKLLGYWYYFGLKGKRNKRLASIHYVLAANRHDEESQKISDMITTKDKHLNLFFSFITLLLFVVLAVNCYFEEWMKNEWGLGAPTFMLFISSFAILGIIYFFIKEIWDNR